MSSFSEVKGIYFDLDDTLCLYWEASKAGLRKTFSVLHPPGFEVEQLMTAWSEAFCHFAPTLKDTEWYPIYLKDARPPRTELMRRTLDLLGIQDDELSDALGQIYAEERDRSLRLFSDAIPVLEELSRRFPLGLITNGPADVQRQEIATLGIGKYFSHVFIEGELGEGKPRESVFRRAQEAMGLAPNELLMIGNSYAHDIAPAIQYGWQTIWLRRETDVPPTRSEVESIPEGALLPDAVLDNLEPILALLSTSR